MNHIKKYHRNLQVAATEKTGNPTNERVNEARSKYLSTRSKHVPNTTTVWFSRIMRKHNENESGTSSQLVRNRTDRSASPTDSAHVENETPVREQSNRRRGKASKPVLNPIPEGDDLWNPPIYVRTDKKKGQKKGDVSIT